MESQSRRVSTQSHQRVCLSLLPGRMAERTGAGTEDNVFQTWSWVHVHQIPDGLTWLPSADIQWAFDRLAARASSQEQEARLVDLTVRGTGPTLPALPGPDMPPAWSQGKLHCLRRHSIATSSWVWGCVWTYVWLNRGCFKWSCRTTRWTQCFNNRQCVCLIIWCSVQCNQWYHSV